MMHFASLLLLAVVGAGGFAAAVPGGYTVHEIRDEDTFPTTWQSRQRLKPDSIVPVRIGLKQQNLDQGEDLLYDVSDPDSPNYGEHWTASQVIEFFKPSNTTVTAVKQWLIGFGISSERITLSDNKAWFAFDASAEELEKLLHTEFYEYQYVYENEKHIGIACNKYLIPTAIQAHIDIIKPGISIQGNYKRQERDSEQSLRQDVDITAESIDKCVELVTPECIRILYNLPLDPNRSVPHNNSLGVYEAGGGAPQHYLNGFYSLYAPYIPNGTHPQLDDIRNASAKGENGEAVLDYEVAYPIIFPQKLVLYESKSPYRTLFAPFLDAIDGSYCTHNKSGKLQCGIFKPTNTISVSYGLQEINFSPAYQKRQCNEFMKLGLQGSSIFFSSGDTGVGDGFGRRNVDGCIGPAGYIFSPAYPCTCYAITTVGATRLTEHHVPGHPEAAVREVKIGYWSGGGFSNLFPAPKYQIDAITTYFERAGTQYPHYSQFGYSNIKDRLGRYNRLGRGYPDVSAAGQRIAQYDYGGPSKGGGTSASCPLFASIITRINDERIAAKKKPLGFLNPILYKNTWALNDITNGSNPGCGTQGFKASVGWDPVTGLGTPDYPKLRELLLNA